MKNNRLLRKLHSKNMLAPHLIVLFVAIIGALYSEVSTEARTILIIISVVSALALLFAFISKTADGDRLDLESSASKAKLEHERIKTLINSMADAVIATDPEGKITLYNAAALNILDTNQDLVGKDLHTTLNVLNEERKPIDILNLSLQKNTSINADNLFLKYNDDELISIRVFVSQVRLGFGSNQEEGFILTLRDITREKSLEEERDEFISVISHELRTPVTITEASISNAQFVADSKSETPQAIKDSLKTAHDEVLFLASMLNDLSTLSRVERGKLDLNPEEFNPKELLEALVKDYQSEFEKKGLKLELSASDDLPKVVVSNHLYVREILQNFITNAQKYTKQGTITLSVKSTSGVTFSVKDTGIGISKTDQQKYSTNSSVRKISEPAKVVVRA